MSRRIRERAKFANVVSVIALFIALGGSAWAATQITSKQIKNGTVKGVDVKDNGLTGADILESSLVLPAAPAAPAAPTTAKASNVIGVNVQGNAVTRSSIPGITVSAATRDVHPHLPREREPVQRCGLDRWPGHRRL